MADPAGGQQLHLDHVSPATRLLEKRRQMLEVQDALETQKEEFARREELFKRREEQLRKKDLDLQESLIRFNKFLQENDSKRARAERKKLEEIRQREIRGGEVSDLKYELDTLTRRREQMKQVVEKNMIYVRFLEKTLETTEDYSEISELLARHATLVAHHDELQSRSSRFSSLADRCRQQLQEISKESQDERLRGHNQVATLQKDLESKQAEAQREVGRIDRRLGEAADRTLEFGKVQWSIDNLYERVRDKAKVRIGRSEDVPTRLRVIRDFFQDLSYVVKGWKQEGGGSGGPSVSADASKKKQPGRES